MKTVRFDCNGRLAPAYTCDTPGDQSGEYVLANLLPQLPRWRSVKEDPPPAHRDVILYIGNYENPYYAFGHHDGGNYFKCGGSYEYPTHWMALPEPPGDFTP